VLLDETWATTNTGPRHIRAPHGERALDAVPHGHWKTTNFAGALRAEGFVAPLVLDGAINGASFLAYVGQFLAPALEPADTVVLDDLASRKVTDVREAIEAVGARLLYLPSYSPDLNRIEMAFRKLLGEFPPSECRRYLARCGHGQAA
jgi:transposase